MKFLAISALIFCIGGNVISFAVQPRHSKHSLKSLIADRLAVRQSNPKGLIPAQDDPMYLEDQEFLFDSENLKGSASIADGVIVGLATLTDDIKINLLTLRVTATVDAAHAKLTGTYTADGIATIAEEAHELTGTGALSASLTKVQTKIGLNLYVTLEGKVAVRNVEVELGFDTLEVNAEDFAMDGHLIDWDETNKQIREVFDTAWPVAKPEVEKALTELLNEVLGEYTLIEIIDIIIGKPPATK